MGAPQRFKGGTQFNIPGETKTVMFYLGALGNYRNKLAEGQLPLHRKVGGKPSDACLPPRAR